MAAHKHIWEHITLSDGAVAQVCLCGQYMVRFAPELPKRQDVFDDSVLDQLEAEGAGEVKDDR